jgi:deoxyribodipyrimidine photo-lyase
VSFETLRLPQPEPGDELGWVAAHLGHLCVDEPRRSARFAGTQAGADAALASFDVTGYAHRRNQVQPVSQRGASGLSPWIRHGLLTLPRVWASVQGPGRDRDKFRDELRWQEYARHVYARLGTAMAEPLRMRPVTSATGTNDAWDRSMLCVGENLGELERDGWMVNQTRMWLASQWSVRHGRRWNDGEQHFFAHLLDGSRAANRLGWQWTAGAATGKAYGFSQKQVQQRAPALCGNCPHHHDCPIRVWPDDPSLAPIDPDPLIRHDPDLERTAGPSTPVLTSSPDTVWLTAESLGDDDPALAAHLELPVWFVFDAPLLASLRLSSKRLVFLADRLAELAAQRHVELFLGDPVAVLAGRRLATTFAPVPGWRRRAGSLELAALYPWSWLEQPRAGSVASFSAWSGSAGATPRSGRRGGRRSRKF